MIIGRPVSNRKRDFAIAEARNHGATFAVLSKRYGVRHQRIQQICAMHNCKRFSRVYPLRAARTKIVFTDITGSAKRRGHTFNLTRREFAAIVAQPCIYGKASAAEGIVVGIDRANNARGYTHGNCVPCCFRHNVIKSNIYTYEEFLDATSRYASLRMCGNKPNRRKQKCALPLMFPN